MTTNTTSNRYPFASKSEIKARITNDPAFAITCLVTLYGLQTEHEQATKTTVNKNHRGFMSSHAVNGCKLAEKMIAGETLTDEETAKATEMVSHYSKQLARHLRDEAVAENPDLAKEAAVFFAPQG